MQSDERLIVALDFPTADLAKNCVEELGDSVCHYKVGMELYYAAGSEIIRFLKEHNKKIFLDLKLHDIPNTVASALAVLTELGADMMNVHARRRYDECTCHRRQKNDAGSCESRACQSC